MSGLDAIICQSKEQKLYVSIRPACVVHSGLPQFLGSHSDFNRLWKINEFVSFLDLAQFVLYCARIKLKASNPKAGLEESRRSGLCLFIGDREVLL